MPPASQRTRYGLPQGIAAGLLLLFAAQAAYLSARLPLSGMELEFLHAGAEAEMSRPAALSPLTVRLGTAGLAIYPAETLARAPFLAMGVLLGASLWYVSRRLYGNPGGYIALTLYAFSPTMITSAARVQPEMAAAWGAFGCIYTGIAVAHTLYAPREVVLWNRKRIAMLAISAAIAASSLFAAAFVVVPLALGFMLYLAPERRRAALAIMGVACAGGLALLAVIYGFRLRLLGRAATLLTPSRWVLSAWSSGLTWALVARFFLRNSPGLALLLLLALAAYAGWPRARYFGNTAPLLTSGLLIVVGLALPHAAGFSLLVVALPFVLLFTAGVASDLLQTRQAPLLSGLILAGLATHAYFSLSGLYSLRSTLF